ncbi:MAG TPA: D-alanyl-D-alanine carboxypeptidase/D-alanyl-D-alanine-endopeptidase [Elusimicrobia bacterium]|nr:D-alanyl-D-alanine carboxypeptidase/D-alanyl-D-alanine-endopeptidase [Elusimicrobiota bacterium]
MLRIALASALLFPPAWAGAARAGGFEAWQSTPALKNALWGLSAAFADSGEPIAAFQADKPLTPASSMKVFVTAAALSTLGGNARFRTRLCRSGTLGADGTLRGDLRLIGGGDPTLGTTLMKGRPSMEDVLDSWADAVKAGGIRRVEGAVLADNSLFQGLPVPGSWSWEDLGNYYAAPADALSLHDNLYSLVFAPGRAASEEARLLRTEPEIPGLRFTNRMRTGAPGSGDEAFVFNTPGSTEATLRGTVPAGAREFTIKGSIPEPALFAARALRSRLQRAAIPVSGESALAAPLACGPDALLAETLSPPLKDIVRVTHRRSVNLYAEMLARALAVSAGRPATPENGAAAVLDFLRSAKIDSSGLRLDDACGLSRRNAVPPKALSDLLAFMSRGPTFDAFRESFAAPGLDETSGSVRTFGKGALEGRLRFKPGFMSGVRSVCGYLSPRSGRLIVFAFIVNNSGASRAEIEDLLMPFLVELAEQR